jgi:serine/threonine-protein kinase HipA
MTTSEPSPRRAFVWVWLPGATEPVVAGRLDVLATRSSGLVPDVSATITFTYGSSYLARHDAIPLYTPELPLRPGAQEPRPGLEIAGCIRDSGPDSWGQRVILARLTGVRGPDADTGNLDQLTYLLSSGTNRIGGIDFRASATDYVPREDTASLETLMLGAEALEEGRPLPPDLAEALQLGTSIGGAHPKALVEDGGRHLIAKFGRPGDVHPWVKAEALGMELGRRVGLFDVPASRVVDVAGRDVLLIERFDRTTVPGQRRIMITALTIPGCTNSSATTPPTGSSPTRSALSSPSPRPRCATSSPESCSTSASATSTTTLATTPGSGTASS